jgi:hypothetical protein
VNGYEVMGRVERRLLINGWDGREAFNTTSRKED